jgi:hypothetical protein
VVLYIHSKKIFFKKPIDIDSNLVYTRYRDIGCSEHSVPALEATQKELEAMTTDFATRREAERAAIVEELKTHLAELDDALARMGASKRGTRWHTDRVREREHVLRSLANFEVA